MKTLSMDFSFSGVDIENSEFCGKADEAFARLRAKEDEYSDWVDFHDLFDKGELARIEKAALDIRQKCTALVVIGIGGSYLGAKAAYEFLGAGEGVSAMDEPPAYPKLYFAGHNMSADYHNRLLRKLQGEDVCLCVISKSGTTAESAIAFSIFKEHLIGRYGRLEAAERIYAVTDEKKGVLREEADREGYESFVVPDGIGGRYSVLTPVGLLPLAAAGFSPLEFLTGAKIASANAELMRQAREYAVCRNHYYSAGKKIEVFESYEPRLTYFAEWLKQLFGESEGKEGVGIFPTSLNFTADLHSMGQFLQEGTQVFFETVLDMRYPGSDMSIPESAGEAYAGKTLNRINRAAIEGVIEAHIGADIPVLRLNIEEAASERVFGQMVYFFETACALSAYMMEVNPFDQPGVEAYKSRMKARL